MFGPTLSLFLPIVFKDDLVIWIMFIQAYLFFFFHFYVCVSGKISSL